MKNARTIKSEEKEPNILRNVVFRYLPYWPLFLLLLLAGAAGAWLYLRYTTPLYQSSARLLIKDERKGSENTRALEDLNLISTKKIIENEVEVIQSRPLMMDVVKTLHLYAPVYEASRIRSKSAYATSPLVVEAMNPDSIAPQKKIDIAYDGKAGKATVNGTAYPLNQWVSTPYGTLRFLPNKRAEEITTGKLYFSLLPVKDVAGSIQSAMEVKTSNKQTTILNLILKDEVPQRGEDILNTLLAAYNKAMLKDKNTLAKNTLAFVEERLKSVEHDLNSIEKKSQQYQARHGAINVSEQGRLFLQNVSANDQRLSDVNNQLAVLGQVKSYVRQKNTEAGIVPSTLGVNDATLSNLVTQLYTKEQEYETLKKTTGEGFPGMEAKRAEISKMRSSIQENINGQEKSLLASRNNLYATNGGYNAMLQSLPEKDRELVDINRERDIKQSIYSFLLQKKEETALSYASTVSDSNVVDPAESSDLPVSPKRKIVYLMSFMIAMFTGIGLVSAKESLSRNIMFRHEIEKLTDHPIVGEIIAEDLKDPIVIGESNKTFIAEQFRRLRTTLKYLGINAKNKRILITSAISGEGKSFIATNLALSLALTGKKVVLIDCDLNNPSLNNKLRIHGEKGLTEYLQGQASAESIIRETDLNENFFLISAGDLPRNPSELLMNGKIEELLNYLDGVFDYLVIDTAPVSPVTDAYTLSPLCHATLFVVRHRYTPKVFVQRIDQENKINELNNLAIVFNGIKSRGFGGKRYGYGYGYGYIYKDKDERYQIGAGK